MYRVVIAPILGGIKCYKTNAQANKMLFRPRRAIYIGKFHIPFTPGLIPQQKSRIAKSLGQMIGGSLLDAVKIEQIVAEKINTFDAIELEKMIFGIMKKELRAIVYLGAALGFCMGFVNLLF